MKCIVLQHLAFEDLGVFADVLSDRGFEILYRQAGIEPLDTRDWIDAELAIVLGGPIGVYETDKYPWLIDEIEAVRRRLETGRPLLGICLGAQLMAAALGARVYPGPSKEIGWAPVELSAAGSDSCLAPLRDAPVLHWHGDTFDLPAGANLLASTAITPHQAFSIGRSALALQFHPEIDGTAIECWLIGHTCELAQTGVDVTQLRAETMRVRSQAVIAGRAMLAAWLDEALPLDEVLPIESA